MSESAADRRHAATPTRLQQARRDGEVAKSHELATAVQLLATILIAYLTFDQLGAWLTRWTTETWSLAGTSISVDAQQVTSQLQNLSGKFGVALLPMLAMLLLVGVGSHWIQTGPLFHTSRAAPDPTRLGPGNWKRHTFSLSGLAFLFVGIPKTVIAAAVLGCSIYHNRLEIFALANYPTDVMANRMLNVILTILFHVGIALFVVSIADFWMKLAGHHRRLLMTDQELRDELRSQNGDPQIRNRQRQMNRI